MSSAPIRRWNPGFIALRWRHLFWSLPLLGLLAGLVVHFLPMIRGTATGIVAVGRVWPTVDGLPTFTSVDVPEIVRSENVLRDTISKLDLAKRWEMDGEKCVAELRGRISSNLVAGSPQVKLSVSGRSRAESDLIWDSLVSASKNYAVGLLEFRHQANLDRLEVQIENYTADVETKRRALFGLFTAENLRFRPNKQPPISSADLTTLRADLEESKNRMELMQIQFLVQKSSLKARDEQDRSPILIREAPGSSSPPTLWDTLRPLVLHSSIGVGSGMVLAVILAYLLELLFPRKAPTL